VFLDESGFMLQPVRRRTWAPSGQTPVQYAWDRHERLSAIAAISVSPRRHALELYFQLLPHNVQTDDMVWFLTQMHRHFRRKIVLVWDRYSVHRAAAKHMQTHHPKWFQFEWLPSYAPDLNPTEQVWNHGKYSDLANFIPDNIEHLGTEVTKSFAGQRENSELLQAFFTHAGLEL
jgi:transposase